MEASFKERLPQIPIFAKAAAEPGAAELLLSILHPKKYASRAVIFEEGSEGSELFVLHRGRVRIQKRTPHGGQYTCVLLQNAGTDFFGEAALMDTERRSASAIADVETECFSMTKNDFIRLGDEHPRIGLLITREIANLAAARLRKANQDIVTLFTALVSEVEGDLHGAVSQHLPSSW